jgi:molybdopterin molybdotransferase
VVSFDQALKIVLSSVHRLPRESVELERALGRILARNLHARVPLPPFTNSAMDGFAVRWRDVQRASAQEPARLKVIGELAAGSTFKKRMRAGEAVKIMTGAAIPADADTVVPVEEVEEQQGYAIVTDTVERGQYVRGAGEDAKRGERVLVEGTVLGSRQIAFAAAAGWNRIPVYREPRLGILVTGDELIAPGRPLPRGKVYNSNLFGLQAAAEQRGARVLSLGVARDSRTDLSARIRRALRQCDVLVTTGGVSMGGLDLVKEALKRCGVRLRFTRVAMRPGRPMTFGTKGRAVVFALPGNPVSCLLGFELFVVPALRRMTGHTGTAGRTDLATLSTPLHKRKGLRFFAKGIAERRAARHTVRSAGSQSSGVLSSLVRANCLIVLPEEITSVKKGDLVRIRWL